LFSRIKKFFSSLLQNRNKKENEVLKLQPLTPKFIDAEHRCYVDVLHNAIENEELLNIALSGNYGVGKSSILHQLSNELGNRSVEVSLSTLEKEDSSDKKQSITNRIQQEIVKQLLYRHKTGKAKGSRFRKIVRWRWKGEVALAAAIGIILTLLFFITGWSAKIAQEISTYIEIGNFDHVLVFLLLFLTSLLIRFISYGRIHIREISAGSATVTLDDKALSYFDQYLDEIVYFFEVYDYTVVIIEDIDRFEDPHIFETLQALNTTLNKSPSQKEIIKFIYAIKDSIFDSRKPQTGRTGGETEVKIDDEVERANRTKFFDLIIPVVPFITHQSARNLVFQIFSDIEHQVDETLVDLVSRYIPDMRLLKNICNEFIVFRNRLFSGDGESLNLKESDLFAMVVYKNTSIADFEKIRFGSSKLDELYWQSRTFIRQNSDRLLDEILDLTQQHENLERLSETSKKLGLRLRTYLSFVGEHSGRAHQSLEKSDNYFLGDDRISNQDFDTVKFWESFLSSDESTPLEWSEYNNHRRNTINVSSSEFLKIYGDEVKKVNWDESERENIKEKWGKLKSLFDLLSNADMKDLIENKYFWQGEDRNTFKTIAEKTLNNPLGFELVKSGYINRNYTLYTSTFHGTRLSAAATNFTIHNINQGKVDINFKLETDDVRALIRENGEDVLDKTPMLNLSVLNYILSNESISNKNFEKYISKINKLGSDEKALLQAYFSQGFSVETLLNKATPYFSRIFLFLVENLQIEHRERLKAISTTLQAISSEVKYETSEEVADFISENYESFSSLRDDSVAPVTVKAIAKIFDELGIKVKDLSLFGEQIRAEFIDNNLYQLNRTNLDYIFSKYSNKALDTIMEANKTVYKYLLANLNEYLSIIESCSPSIVSNEGFTRIVNTVAKSDEGYDYVNWLISLASEQCVVDDLNPVSIEAWIVLANNMRISPTFHNIKLYIDQYGIDVHLAAMLLKTKAIEGISIISTDSKQNVAISILNAEEMSGYTEERIRLVNSLELEKYIPLSEITLENGKFIPELLKNNLIEDSVETYQTIQEMSSDTKELYVKESEGFPDYMQSMVNSADAALFLISEHVASDIKMELVKHADDYFYNAEDDELHALAKFAIKHNMQISSDMVAKIAEAKFDSEKISVLLEPHLSNIHIDELAGILQLMNEEFSQLGYVGRERPKILNTTPNQSLLETLKKFGIVTKGDPEGDYLRVSKRHKPV